MSIPPMPFSLLLQGISGEKQRLPVACSHLQTLLLQ
jgi:hypothetical protein